MLGNCRHDAFLTLRSSIAVEVIEENLPDFIDGAQRERYLRSFVDMAGRVLFSYDVSEGGGYRLIAKPQKIEELTRCPRVLEKVCMFCRFSSLRE